MVLSLHVAMQHGPSLRPNTSDVRRMVSEDSVVLFARRPFLLIVWLTALAIGERLSDCRCHLRGDEHRRIRQVFQQIVEFL
jgi:hypothetical protein